MVDIFITDSQDEYQRSKSQDKILFLDGFISACSFVKSEDVILFNSQLIGLEDRAHGLMLEQMDKDLTFLTAKDIKFNSNRFISDLPFREKLNSVLFNYYKDFVGRKYLFQLVLDKFFSKFAVEERPLVLCLSEKYYLTQELPYKIHSSSYYRSNKSLLIKHLLRQVYFFFYDKLKIKKLKQKTRIALFLFDIPNEVDVVLKFVEHIRKRKDLSLCIVEMHSGNPDDKRIDASKYKGDNINVIYLHEQKINHYTNYQSFYDFCRKLNPLYSTFEKSRICELEDVKYGFTDKVISQLEPEVCLYVNTQEFGRILSNVCRNYKIPCINLDYSFFFDNYTIERRIKFDIRACISELTVNNWKKHNDPTPLHEIIGFCKIDNWKDKILEKGQNPLFKNDRRTILFASTWAPNKKSPLLTEKVEIAKQLSEICHRNRWNLIIKKHPSEFDNLIKDVLDSNEYENQKIFDHTEISLFDCMVYSDFICTQNSSAFIEALYLNKPFSYVTIYDKNVWADMSYFAQEKEVGNFNSLKEYEQYITHYSSAEEYDKLQNQLKLLQKKYLYKTDGKASERLLALVESFLKR